MAKVRDYSQIVADHAANLKTLTVTSKHSALRFHFRITALKNQARYEAVAKQTGIPWPLIAALHHRESASRFDTYLHNGDPLGVPTTHVPKGKLFHDWESAAIDALRMFNTLAKKVGITETTAELPPLLAFAEAFNGFGYRDHGRVSPYCYSGTSLYVKGKYVADGVYNPDAQDQQLGVAEMLLDLASATEVPASSGEPDFEDPKTIQQLLIDVGYDLGPAGADGKLGKKSKEAIKNFQRAHLLKADGVVGEKTREKMLQVWNLLPP